LSDTGEFGCHEVDGVVDDTDGTDVTEFH
jgi:hypothetical protein